MREAWWFAAVEPRGTGEVPAGLATKPVLEPAGSISTRSRGNRRQTPSSRCVERDDLLGLLASARRAPDRRGTLGVVSKQALRDELLAQLVAALDAARAAYAAAIEGATHPEARAENAKDTRGLEQSYIARGQAQRVAELEVAVAELTKLELRALQIVAIGAVIAVDEDGATRRYFLVPHGGGNVLAGDIQVITPASPRGRALLGKRVGEIAELAVAGKTRELEITGVT
jgi:transcription elongation GreA/GreB family factor